MIRTRAGIKASLAVLWLAPATGGLAYGQVGADNGGSINVGARGAIGAEAPVRTAPPQERPDSSVEFNFRAGFASDYIYRGTSLSARQPAVGAAFEAAFDMFYGSATITSVRLPSRRVPSAARRKRTRSVRTVSRRAAARSSMSSSKAVPGSWWTRRSSTRGRGRSCTCRPAPCGRRSRRSRTRSASVRQDGRAR